jgi:hypothetical protein
MKRSLLTLGFLASACLFGSAAASAGQAPGAASDPDIPISHRDRVYSAEQFSNTVSVTDPVDNKLVGVIRLGDPQPGNFSPLYKGQVLVHGMGFSPDHKTIAWSDGAWRGVHSRQRSQTSFGGCGTQRGIAA